MKCAASAESDVFVQAVALFIAVIPQIARRCHLLVGWLLRAATIAFTTRLWANSDKGVIWERHLLRLQDEKRGAHVPENIVPISDWSTMFPRICVLCFLADRQPWVAVFGIADTSAIPKIVSYGKVNPFPIKPMGYSFMCQRFSTFAPANPNESVWQRRNIRDITARCAANTSPMKASQARDTRTTSVRSAPSCQRKTGKRWWMVNLKKIQTSSKI